jgi:hypothetical protein
MSKLRQLVVTTVVVVAGFGLSACCQANSAKTAECKDSASSEKCQECCGGSGYSYTGEGSCSCY